MKPVFHTVKCPGIDCPRFLRYSVAETDYGMKKVLGCPRCFAEISITIPLPTVPPSVGDGGHEGSSFTELFKNISDLFENNKNNK